MEWVAGLFAVILRRLIVWAEDLVAARLDAQALQGRLARVPQQTLQLAAETVEIAVPWGSLAAATNHFLDPGRAAPRAQSVRRHSPHAELCQRFPTRADVLQLALQEGWKIRPWERRAHPAANAMRQLDEHVA